MLYSKVDLQAFSTPSVAVGLCSFVIKGTTVAQPEIVNGGRDAEGVEGVGCEEG